jgi:DNA-directed RNA polymerase specialized sigma24 family protein
VERERGSAFRTFLYGVVRKVALRYEERAGRKGEAPAPSAFDPEELDAREERLSILFDRAWAKTVLARAGERHRARAEREGEAGRRRLELLRLRFGEGLPIREIAARWSMEPALLHAEYRKAREEFKQALREEVAFHHPGTPRSIERECETLLAVFR